MARVPDDQYANPSVRGIVRRIDELGRLVIPKEYRKIFGIEVGDLLDMTLSGDGILVRKVQHACVFCGSQDDLGLFKNHLVCDGCVTTLRESL